MTDHRRPSQARINAKIAEVEHTYSGQIRALLNEINKTRLNGKGKVTAAPVIETNNIHWTLAWKAESTIALELSVVVGVEDNGHEARVGRVWVHRHAATPLDYEGHTPTTRMRRLTGLSINEIREAIDAVWS